MQFTNVALLALASAVSAAPLSERQSAHPFSVISARSGSPVHLLPFTARGEQIWLGGNTSTYCPSGVDGLDCSQFKNYTSFVSTAGNPVAIAMNANVPGGQGLYVDPSGAIKFTQAHSGFTPDGSVRDGFSYTPGSGNGATGNLAPVVNGSTAFIACPQTSDEKSTGPFQVFADVANAQVPSGCKDDCLGFDALTEAATDDSVAAWQYA